MEFHLLFTLDVGPAFGLQLPQDFLVLSMGHGNGRGAHLGLCLRFWLHVVELTIFILLIVVVLVIWFRATRRSHILQLVLQLSDGSRLALVRQALLVQLLEEL